MPRMSCLVLLFSSLSLLAFPLSAVAGSYTIQSGDTPAGIAKKHGISVEELMKANKGLHPNKMRVGESLNIPGGKDEKKHSEKQSKEEKGGRKSEPSSAKEEKAGRKAEQPSAKERAAEARDREKEHKAASAKSGTYTVKKGDTLGEIASKLGVSVGDLRKANKGLDARQMKIGQELVVPGGGAPASETKPEPAEKPSHKAEKEKTPEAPTEPTTTYHAHKRDTPEKVAKKFHISVKELARLNPDMGKKLHSGQKLTVPAVAAPTKAAPAEELPSPEAEPEAAPQEPAKGHEKAAKTAEPAAVPSVPESKDAADAESSFEKGIEFGKQNKFQKAVESFDRAIKLNPNRADFFASRGHANYYMKQYPKAIDDYTKAIEKNPSFALAYSMRGLSRTRSGRYQQAIEDFNKAISLGPNEADYYKGRGFTYLNLKQYSPMCQDYKKACELGDCELMDSAKKEKLCQ